MTDVNDDAPRDGEISQGSVTPDLPPTLLESAMATGEDDGTPGERGPIDPSDATALEVADDAPDLSQNGGPQGDGLEPRFSEPTD
ncbi:MAG TPA: hypothetical protein VEV65_00760 [Kineosporiaceae bacterium]|jgi:hypothetical protein|nr:hypothetical protein [Kineosporiaceae bacterium]